MLWNYAAALHRSKDDLEPRQGRVLAIDPHRRCAQGNAVAKPGTLAIELDADPRVQVPVEAEGHLGRPIAEQLGIGQLVLARVENLAVDVEVRHTGHQLPCAWGQERMHRIIWPQRLYRRAVGG